jgi:hypothetical protein
VVPLEKLSLLIKKLCILTEKDKIIWTVDERILDYARRPPAKQIYYTTRIKSHNLRIVAVEIDHFTKYKLQILNGAGKRDREFENIPELRELVIIIITKSLSVSDTEIIIRDIVDHTET